MTKAVLSVVSSEAGRIQQMLAGIAGIYNAIVVGDSVHALVDDASLRQSKIQLLLDGARIPYTAIEPVSPTIEDFFVDALASGGYQGWQTSSDR